MSRAGHLIRRISEVASGATVARSLLAGSDSVPKSLREKLERTNHRGETVSLLSGPVLALAATSAAVSGAGSKRLSAAAAIAGLGTGAVGLYDDIVGARPDQKGDKGFRGHLTALSEGRISAGLVKVAGIGAAGLAAGALVASRRGHGNLAAAVDTVLAGGIIAGTANLVNLLDLRPGRALKASVAIGAPLSIGPAGGLAAGPTGAAAALLPEDLGEKTMLGDTGANAIGALLGLGIATAAGTKTRVAVLAALVGLTVASEKVSFTKVIESTPGLRELDGLGRRPRPA